MDHSCNYKEFKANSRKTNTKMETSLTTATTTGFYKFLARFSGKSFALPYFFDNFHWIITIYLPTYIMRASTTFAILSLTRREFNIYRWQCVNIFAIFMIPCGRLNQQYSALQFHDIFFRKWTVNVMTDLPCHKMNQIRVVTV